MISAVEGALGRKENSERRTERRCGTAWQHCETDDRDSTPVRAAAACNLQSGGMRKKGSAW